MKVWHVIAFWFLSFVVLFWVLLYHAPITSSYNATDDVVYCHWVHSLTREELWQEGGKLCHADPKYRIPPPWQQEQAR